MNKTKISFTDKQLSLIQSALEILYRLRSGQVGMAMDIVYFDKGLSWDEQQDIERFIRDIVFNGEKDRSAPANEPTAYSAAFGVGNKEIGEGNLAYEIEKTIRQYLSVKKNNGYWEVNCGFYDPLKITDEPLPEIEGFNKWIDFPLTVAQSKKILRHYTKKDYLKMWQEYDKLELDLPKCEKREIIPIDAEKKVVIRCHKPQKKT